MFAFPATVSKVPAKRFAHNCYFELPITSTNATLAAGIASLFFAYCNAATATMVAYCNGNLILRPVSFQHHPSANNSSKARNSGLNILLGFALLTVYIDSIYIYIYISIYLYLVGPDYVLSITWSWLHGLLLFQVISQDLVIINNISVL